HKVSILPLLDEVSPLGQQIGAINTVTLEAGRLYGTNTDCYGALQTIEDHESIDGKRITILGAGGAARAIAYALACERKPDSITLAARNPLKAEELVAELSEQSLVQISHISFAESELRENLQQAHIIVN